MNKYIFLANKGQAFQLDLEGIEPDYENEQIVGYATGKNPEESFNNLINEKYLR